ncbi:hypothetical protein B0H14DRAFT_2856951 [Mycena olivaceomarginata]|nr:hypothetical protein B0H14DRAFT_2856951 [Mycena olivaceomarginata]
MPPLFPPPPPSSPPLHRFLLRPWNRRRRSPMRPPPPRRRRPHTTAGAAPNCPLHTRRPEPAHALADAACYAPSVRVGNDCRRPRYRRCPRPMSPGSMLMNRCSTISITLHPARTHQPLVICTAHPPTGLRTPPIPLTSTLRSSRLHARCPQPRLYIAR